MSRPRNSSVHINVLCPHCHSRYRLDESMRGVQMRCPNSGCRAVFEVREEPGAAPASEPDAGPPEDDNASEAETARQERARQGSRTDPPEGGGYQTGSIGDLVPILQA